MEMMTRCVRVVVVLSVLGGGALAESAVEGARTHFKRGAELYDEGNLQAALVEFKRAHQLAPNYKLLYNIAQVHVQLQDYARAVDNFSRYLSEGGDDINARRREEVAHELERLKGRIGQLRITAQAGREVLVDEESVGFAPLPRALAVNSGRHKVSVMSDGKPETRVVEVAGLQTLEVVFAAERVEAASVVTQPVAASSGSRVPAVVAWATAAALGVGAGVMSGVAFSNGSQLAKLRQTFNVTQAELKSQSNQVVMFSAVADGLLAGAVIAGGVALWLTLTSGESAAPVAVGFGPSGVFAVGRF